MTSLTALRLSVPSLGLTLALAACSGGSTDPSAGTVGAVSASGSGLTVDVLPTVSFTGGFVGAVRITDTAFPGPISSFEIEFRLGGTASVIGAAWNGSIAAADASGKRTATSPDWLVSQPIRVGQTWDVGFNGSGTFAGSTIMRLKINGATIALGGGGPGEELFRGLMFGQGETAAAFPEMWPQGENGGIVTPARSYTSAELAGHVADALSTLCAANCSAATVSGLTDARNRLLSGEADELLVDPAAGVARVHGPQASAIINAVIAIISESSPSFFANFGTRMTSGDPVAVREGLKDAARQMAAAADILETRIQAGVPITGLPSLNPYTELDGPVFLVVVIAIAVVLVLEPVPFEQNGIQITNDIVVARIASRLRASAPPPPPAVFRVNTDGRITRNGQVFPVRCGSWFGLDGHHEPSTDPTNPRGAPMELYVGNIFRNDRPLGSGRTLALDMAEVAAAGINMIRVPVVPQTLDAFDPQGREPNLKNHPSVRVANSRLALEQLIRTAAQNNVQVLLDMHSCSNFVGWRKGRLDARPPYVDRDREDYDFKREDASCAATANPPGVTRIQAYSDVRWLNDLRTLAGLGQQLGVDNILGIDLFNEPWDYTWAEWKTLTEHAFQAINAVNPNILVFVEGVSGTAGNQDGTPTTTSLTPFGDPNLNPSWGENLFEAGASPPSIPKDRLVFSPHSYGPSVFVQRQFMDWAQPQCTGMDGDAAGNVRCNVVINPPLLRQGWEQHFGYLKQLGYAVVGEFGGNLDWPRGQTEVRDQNRWGYLAPGTDSEWQNAFVDYLVSKGIEACYWAINPESRTTAGWYLHDYEPLLGTAGWGEWRPFDARKTALLNRLWAR